MKIFDCWEAIQSLPCSLQLATNEIRLTREQLHQELRSTRVLAEKAFLAIMKQLEDISQKLENIEKG